DYYCQSYDNIQRAHLF
nr:immunoglobulin light chain junction region [Macaca mulatta]MOX80450.1 immunoglobulin light chain junction region [Macaca mulatta]MOX82148.1 immunoglobulin light chain junction region [Macaca mulatta]